MNAPVTPLKTLLLEDDENDARLIVRWLEKEGYVLDWRVEQTEEGLLGVLNDWTPDIVLSDHSMPNLNSVRGIEILRERGIEVPVVLVSGAIGEEAAVEVMRQGASDFVSKFHPARLAPAVERALEANRLRLDNERVARALRESEAKYRHLFDHAPDGIILLDGDRFVDCNGRAGEIFGYGRDELVGMTPLELSPEYQPDGQRSADKAAAMIEAARAGERQSFEWMHVHRDGSAVLARVDLGPVEGITGVDLQGIVEDVTEQRELERREREQYAMLQGISEGTTDIIFVKDLKGRYVHLNSAGAKAVGRDLDELWGRTDFDLFPSHKATLLTEHDRAVLETGETVQLEEQVELGGSEWLLQTVKGVCRDGEGNAIGVFGVARDVTDQRRLEAERHKLSRALQQAGDAVIITDRERRIEYVNPAFERITGYAAAEVIGETPRMLRSGKTDPEVKARFEAALAAGERFQGVFVNRRRNGELYYADMSMAPVPDDTGAVTHYIATHSDVTEKLRVERELERLTHYDPVTGLGNRALLRDRLEQLLSRLEDPPARIAVLHIDLDDFGRVNESFGQPGGDQVLLAVGQRLVILAGPNASVGRTGGDSFVVLVSLAGPDERAEHVAQRIQIGIAAPIAVDGQEILLTASIGMAFAPDDSAEVEPLLQGAEAALHRAKESGGEQIAFYAQGMTEEAKQWVETHADLRRALERGQFVLEYQPKVSLEGGRIEGAEALLRWQHPERGRIPPDQFVPLLEKTGLIVTVGEWVIREACRQVNAWRGDRADGGGNTPGLRVSVNLSLEQFRQRDLTAVVRAVLDDTGTNPQDLELELTESSLARDPEAAARTLHALHELGVTIALDDFGKGYSSLTYLRRFPIDVLKIDREFINWVTESPEDAAILRAVLRLTRDLGIEAVAEGVETEEQLRFLMVEGCRFAQGYYFARPLPPDEFARLRAGGKPYRLPDLTDGSDETETS